LHNRIINATGMHARAWCASTNGAGSKHKTRGCYVYKRKVLIFGARETQQWLLWKNESTGPVQIRLIHRRIVRARARKLGFVLMKAKLYIRSSLVYIENVIL